MDKRFQALQRGFEADPGNVSLREQLASAYLRHGETARAYQLMIALDDLDPRDIVYNEAREQLVQKQRQSLRQKLGKSLRFACKRRDGDWDWCEKDEARDFEQPIRAITNTHTWTPTLYNLIPALPLLEELDLDFCKRPDYKSLSQLASHPRLRVLKLPGQKIKGQDLSFLKDLPKLEELHFSHGQKLTDKTLAPIFHNKELRTLTILGAPMTDKWGQQLETLRSLRSLTLRSCDKLSDKTLKAIATLTQLEHLDLGWIGHFSAAGLASLSSLTSLKSLNLEYARHMSVETLEALQTLVNLEHLHLGSCDSGDAWLAPLGQFNNLKTLNLRDGRFNAEAFSALRDLKQLRTLNLEYTFTSASAVKRILSLEGLEVLD